MPLYLQGPPDGPFARLATALLGVLVLAGAAFFGLFLLAAVIALGLVGWIALRLRLWWLGRRLPTAGPGAAGTARSEARGGEVIEAEYEVVSRESRED